jgi:hypothetical protein
VRSLKTSMAKNKRQTDNDLHNTTEKTKDLARGLFMMKIWLKIAVKTMNL